MKNSKHTPGQELIWKKDIYAFYKVDGKFTQSADLIRRVVSKCDKEAVTPLVDELQGIITYIETYLPEPWHNEPWITKAKATLLKYKTTQP